MARHMIKVYVDGYMVDLYVDHTPSSEVALGEWHGIGTAQSYIEPGLYKTNVGDIIVTRVSLSSPPIRFDFQGSGPFTINE